MEAAHTPNTDPSPASSAGDESISPAARAPRDPRPVVNVPDGRARLVGEVAVRPSDRPDEELVVQALESQDGEPLVRVGYRRHGRMLRGPMTAAAADLAALVVALRADSVLPEGFWAAAGLLPAGQADDVRRR
jgi:hypothetical protein